MYTELLSQFLNKNNSHYIINKVNQKMDVYGEEKRQNTNKTLFVPLLSVHRFF